MKKLFDMAALCIILFIGGYASISQKDVPEESKAVAEGIMIIAAVAFCIIVIKIITLKRLAAIAFLCVILFLSGYPLYPDDLKADILKWIQSIVTVMAVIAFIILYIMLSLVGIVIELTGKVIKAADTYLASNHPTERPWHE